MDLFESIFDRRSVRKFTEEPVTDQQLEKILDAGRWAPSGKNTQPWSFVVVRDPEVQKKLENHSGQGIIESAPITIGLLKDTSRGYDELKDAQGIGACAQNILLAVHGLGLGACWLGLTRDSFVEELLGAEEDEELMMLISVGRPAAEERSSDRKPLEALTRYI
ncbi:MAG: nitroreductase family protein [Candidatus Acetothermia bacterium]